MTRYDIIFFHHPCSDGIASAWIANRYLKSQLDSQIESNLNGYQMKQPQLVGLAHNKPDLGVDIREKRLLFLDIAPNDRQLELVEQLADDYLILDHHKTNAEKFASHPKAIFRMDKSAVGITWEHFYPGEAIPLFLQMIQDRDLWAWVIPNSDSFCEAFYFMNSSLDTIEESLSLLDSFNDDPTRVDRAIEIGEILKRKKQKTIENTAKASIGKTYYYNGLKVALANCIADLGSDLGNYILKNYDYDFIVCWRYSHVNEDYWMSLRSNGKVDVSEICKVYGGGGHRNAAGMTSKIHPILLWGGVSSPTVYDP